MKHGLGCFCRASIAGFWLATLLFAQAIPQTWDETALATGQLRPPVGSAVVRPAPASYYYRKKERVIYRVYPVYSSAAEPPAYLDQLAGSEPEIVFDASKLKTEQDWIAAGREVFRYPITAFPATPDLLRSTRETLERFGVRPARDGSYPQFALVVPKKGVVLAGFLSCATCHTRVQPDGSVIEGAQGNLPDLLLGFPPDVNRARAFQRALYRVPWLENDPIDRVQSMSIDEINAVKASIPLGVMARHGTSISPQSKSRI